MIDSPPQAKPVTAKKPSRLAERVRTHVPTFRHWGRLYTAMPIRRVARLYGLGAVLLLATIAGFNRFAENRWQAYRARALARGVQLFDPADVPKAVPTDQNFFAAPVFAPGSNLTADFNGRARPLLWLEFGENLATGTRPEFNLPRQRITAHYPEIAQDPRDFASIYLDLVTRHSAGRWNEVLAAEARPLAQNRQARVSYGSTGISRLNEFWWVSQIHHRRALALLHLKRPDEALGELQGYLRMSSVLGGDTPSRQTHLSLRTLVGAISCIWAGLDEHQWTGEHLDALQAALEQISVEERFHAAIEVERRSMNLLMEDELSRQIADRTTGFKIRKPETYRSLLQWVDGCIRESMVAANENCDAAHAHIKPGGNWQMAVTQALDITKLRPVERFRYYHFSNMWALTVRPVQMFASTEVRRRHALLAIAIERHWQAHGQALPETLESLAADLPPEVFTDPYDGKPMRYTKTTGQSYLLWSIGPNGIDDGGSPSSGDLFSALRDIVWHGPAPVQGSE